MSGVVDARKVDTRARIILCKLYSRENTLYTCGNLVGISSGVLRKVESPMDRRVGEMIS